MLIVLFSLSISLCYFSSWCLTEQLCFLFFDLKVSLSLFIIVTETRHVSHKEEKLFNMNYNDRIKIVFGHQIQIERTKHDDTFLRQFTYHSHNTFRLFWLVLCIWKGTDSKSTNPSVRTLVLFLLDQHSPVPICRVRCPNVFRRLRFRPERNAFFFSKRKSRRKLWFYCWFVDNNNWRWKCNDFCQTEWWCDDINANLNEKFVLFSFEIETMISTCRFHHAGPVIRWFTCSHSSAFDHI